MRLPSKESLRTDRNIGWSETQQSSQTSQSSDTSTTVTPWHGEEHTEFALAVVWLGFVLNAQGRYGEATAMGSVLFACVVAAALAAYALGNRRPQQ